MTDEPALWQDKVLSGEKGHFVLEKGCIYQHVMSTVCSLITTDLETMFSKVFR